MKTRSGFVSNSSSSSFLIWGISVETDKMGDDFNIDDFCDDYLCIGGPDRDWRFFLGHSPDGCGDDETMGEFKKRTEKDVKDWCEKHSITLPDSTKFGWLEEAWRDG